MGFFDSNYLLIFKTLLHNIRSYFWASSQEKQQMYILYVNSTLIL